MTIREQCKPHNFSETRGNQINLRLSSKEYAKLTRSAALCGIGRTTYLRMILLENWRKESAEHASFSAK